MLDARRLARRDGRCLHEVTPLRVRRHLQHAEAFAGFEVLHDLARELALLVWRNAARELRTMMTRERAQCIRLRCIFNGTDELLPHLPLRTAGNTGHDGKGPPGL